MNPHAFLSKKSPSPYSPKREREIASACDDSKVQGFNARKFVRGILTLASPERDGEEFFLHRQGVLTRSAGPEYAEGTRRARRQTGREIYVTG